MGLDEHGFSPAALKKIARAMGQLHSGGQAAFALNELADIKISCSQVQRIAQQLGHEMAEQRDQKTLQQRRRELPARVELTPEVVAVEVDGGHLRTRASNRGVGVHDVEGKENKVACLVTLKSHTSENDPQPEPPDAFRQPRRVQRLVAQVKGWSAGNGREDEENAVEPEESTANRQSPPSSGPSPSPTKEDYRGRPHRVVRTCLASMARSAEFGPMMAAEAQERNFYNAKRKAFVGDGASYNWTIHRGYFKDFEPVVDVLHVLCYLYVAAWGVGGGDGEGWPLYERWLCACWQGRVGEVIEQLQAAQERLGVAPPGEPLERNDPRRLVSEALTYLSNNQGRMDYPRYRREGLPITSSLVESLVGDFNARVKSRQKFWNRPDGVEPILQLRAAVLSEDGRLDRFFEQRPGYPYCKRMKQAA